MFRNWAVFLICAATVGCASAEKRVEQGHEAEAEGRWDEAVDLYVDALRRDPEVPGGRDRLRLAGKKALLRILNLAKEFEEAGSDEQCAEEYVRADELVNKVGSVRVVLKRPKGYKASRRAAFDRVIEARLDEAGRLALNGHFAQAADAYREAVARYEPSAQQRVRAQKGRYRALVGAASQALELDDFDRATVLADEAVAVYGPDSKHSKSAVTLRARVVEARYDALLRDVLAQLKDGRFQHAYALTQDALTIYGPDAEESAAAHALAEQVIVAGTVTVAVPPMWRHDQAARLPDGLLDEVNDVLAQEHWNQPPLFVATLDPQSVRTELRGLGLDRRVLENKQACVVGERLDAHFLAVAAVRSCSPNRGRDPEVHRLATRDGSETEVSVYRRRVLAVTCAVRLVRVADGRVMAERVVEARAEAKCAHAAGDGRARDFLMTTKQHRWFDRRRLAEVDRKLEREVAETLAASLADAVYEEVTKHLP